MKEKKIYRNNLLLVAFAICCIGLAVLALNLYSNHQVERDLASLKSFSFEDRFSQTIQVQNYSEYSSLKLHLGNMQDSICTHYEKLSLEFEAEDVAVSGDRPKLIVQMDCSKLKSAEGAFQVKLPNQVKAQRQPSSVQVDTPLNGVELRYEGTIWVWPEQWSLSRVKFEAGGSELVKDQNSQPWIKEKKIQW